ncbi:MAG TPA: antitermination protein NusG [Gammaproteobacteria bacterium]|nr:antitermination protein NusG [Gammaproteobacteria bacterium]HIK68905.1 antitermination protein NusG [Pseudomonadales bacterium]
MDTLFSMDGVNYLFRWGHFLAGITWIGLLYYFNFVQTEYFKEADGEHRSGAIQKLVPRALWWFRWGAALTFLTGLYLLYVLHGAWTYDIAVGAILGTLMAFNVWFIIWPNQQIVIASATQVAGGGEPLAEAASAAPKAGLASRSNTLFSIPMLFFMGSSAHMQTSMLLDEVSTSTASLVAVFVIILALEINAIRGQLGPMASVKGVIHCGLLLTAVLYGLMVLL